MHLLCSLLLSNYECYHQLAYIDTLLILQLVYHYFTRRLLKYLVIYLFGSHQCMCRLLYIIHGCWVITSKSVHYLWGSIWQNMVASASILWHLVTVVTAASRFHWLPVATNEFNVRRKRHKMFLVMPIHFFGSTSTISRFYECFHHSQYNLVSFLFAVLLLTVPDA